MTNTTPRREIPAEYFYRTLRMRCPSCSTEMSVDDSARGATVMFDQCPGCQRYLVLDLTNPSATTGNVVVEAHDDMVSALAAGSQLGLAGPG